MTRPRRSKPRPAAWWALGVSAAATGVLVYAGAMTGDWHAALVSEVQVVVVGAVAFLGLR